MRHLTNESTSSGFFSDVMKRSGSASSKVRMRMSNWRTFCSSGHLKCRPGFWITSFTSPSWKMMAFWRWSTVNTVPETMAASTTTMATIGPKARMLAVAPLAGAQRVARARARRRRGVAARALRRRRLGERRRAALLHDLVERQVEQVARAAIVHHDLVGRGQDLLQGLEVDALARHRRRLGVFGQHLPEARGGALGGGGGPGAGPPPPPPPARGG